MKRFEIHVNLALSPVRLCVWMNLLLVLRRSVLLIYLDSEDQNVYTGPDGGEHSLSRIEEADDPLAAPNSACSDGKNQRQ